MPTEMGQSEQPGPIHVDEVVNGAACLVSTKVRCQLSFELLIEQGGVVCVAPHTLIYFAAAGAVERFARCVGFL